MVDGPSLDEFNNSLVASQGPPIDLHRHQVDFSGHLVDFSGHQVDFSGQELAGFWGKRWQTSGSREPNIMSTLMPVAGQSEGLGKQP